MATFAKADFSYTSYAALRPSYPRSLYDLIFSYHRGPKSLCADLGCGPGIVTRAIAQDFETAIGVDPSPGMIEQAQANTDLVAYPNVSFQSGPAEELPFFGDNSVDAILSGQAAHWFDYPRVWASLARVLRQGGTVAFWTYGNPFFVDYPRATEIIAEWSYNSADKDKLGPYWSQPGRSIVEQYYRPIVPAEEFFEDVKRFEYVPDTKGASSGKGEQAVRLYRKATVGQWREYFRTWSAWHGWHEAHPDIKPRKDGGTGDVMDRMFDEISAAEGWQSDDLEVELEWGTGLVIARRK
ncbi:putative ubie coq5 protein [Neofusicoccum parvum UCRNP2]|uniref:Putative ubie coq5 protein n=1 Tax=Botryosphaeria parva (strain UCR-NP2) TaxID=1287680 RepID=R1G710_BOTPV|nr:putative ubie coq5 protein [Neofusicoccum parvum UCRNP2]